MGGLFTVFLVSYWTMKAFEPKEAASPATVEYPRRGKPGNPPQSRSSWCEPTEPSLWWPGQAKGIAYIIQMIHAVVHFTITWLLGIVNLNQRVATCS